MQEIIHTKSNLRAIPSVDKVLNTPEIKELLNQLPRWLILKITREVLDEMRGSVAHMKGPLDQDTALRKTVDRVREKIDAIQKTSLRRVINGTGIIIHTNLGRSPLPDEVLHLINEVAKGYSNLEYNLLEGKRGKRVVHVQDLILRLTGAHEAFTMLIAEEKISEGLAQKVASWPHSGLISIMELKSMPMKQKAEKPLRSISSRPPSARSG